MKHVLWSRAAALALGATLLTSGLAAQQALGGPVAAQVAAASVLAEKQPGCWGCSIMGAVDYCQGGYVPGYFNCSYTQLTGSCQVSSPGCGAGAALPLDPDGSTQYVSRAPAAGVLARAAPDTPDLLRNCEGVVVARQQSEAEILASRGRTASLTL